MLNSNCPEKASPMQFPQDWFSILEYLMHLMMSLLERAFIQLNLKTNSSSILMNANATYFHLFCINSGDRLLISRGKTKYIHRA